MPLSSSLGWKLAILSTLLFVGLSRADEDRSAKMVPFTFRSYVAVDERYPRLVPEKPPEEKKPANPKTPSTNDGARDPRDRTDKIHCFVTELGQSPVVIVFTRTIPKVDSTQSGLIKQLDEQVAKHRASRLSAVVEVLLLAKEFNQDDETVGNDLKNLKREAVLRDLRAYAAGLKVPQVPFGLAAKASEQVDKWGITADDDFTVVVYNRMKIAKRWSFKKETPPTEEDAKAIIEAVDKVAFEKN